MKGKPAHMHYQTHLMPNTAAATTTKGLGNKQPHSVDGTTSVRVSAAARPSSRPPGPVKASDRIGQSRSSRG